MKLEWKSSLLAFISLLIATTANGQTSPCTLKLSELPVARELIGFRLGMTREEVKARVPQIAFGPTDDLGTSKTTINPDFDSRIDKSSFAGVRSISLDFLDSRLTSLWLGYDGTFKWSTVDQFVEGISKSLKLPNAWDSWRGRGRQLKCADFAMTVTIVAEGPSFRILDQTADDLLATRRQEKEEKESATENGEQPPEIIADRHNKTYYPSDCQPTNPIKDADRLVFKSVDEAERAGFKKSKTCEE
jgi:hypothetical protein